MKYQTVHSPPTDFEHRVAFPHKKSYVAESADESFIVPLLRIEIERLLNVHILGGTLLDVGCGNQPFRPLVESLGCSYSGLDVVPRQLLSAQKVGAIDDPLLRSKINFPPSYHFLLCTEVMEHVADWKAAFDNFSRLSHVGSKLLITSPFVFNLHEEPFDFWRPTSNAIEYFGKEFGFKVIERLRAGSALEVLGTLLGNCKFSGSSSSLKSRTLAKLCRGLKKIYLHPKIQETFKDNIEIDCGYYLSNIVLMEKQ